MTIRIDFGLILPGLVILALGVILFAVWILVALFSFFLFFVPELHGIFYFGLNLLAASLVLMLAGGVVMFAGTSGWFGSVAERRLEKDRLRPGERFGEIFGVIISALILLFFIENQLKGTGFFTAAFGVREQFLFYGPAIFGILVSLARATYGRRNAIRPLEIFQAAFISTAALWLVFIFPFNFAHLTDLIPVPIGSAFFWVSDEVAQIVLWLAVIGSLASLVYTSVLYATVRAHVAGGIHGAPGA